MASAGKPKNSKPTTQTRDWRTMHLWQFQPLRDILVFLAVVGLLWLGYKLSVVTVPILLALALAYLFEPVVRLLCEKVGMSRHAAALGIIFSAGALVVIPAILVVAFAVIQGADYAARVATNTEALITAVGDSDTRDQAYEELPINGWRDIADYARRMKEEARLLEEERRNAIPAETPSGPATNAQTADSPAPQQDLPSNTDTPDPVARNRILRSEASAIYRAIDFSLNAIGAHATAIGARAFGGGVGAVGAALQTLTSLGLLIFTAFLTAFFFFFFSSGYARVLAFTRKLIPDAHSERTIELAQKMDRVVAAFIRGRLTIAAIQAIVFSIAYWLVGVPAPLLLGVLVALLSIVPYLALVGIPISIVGLWLEPSGALWMETWWWTLGAPLAVYFLGQSLDDYVWTPLIQGKSTDMDTPTILFASLAGGALAGVYGLLLAIPVAACLKILLTEIFWPHFKDWTEGKAPDPLPFSRSSRSTKPEDD